MKSIDIEINGIPLIANDNGSVTRKYRYSSAKTTFGSRYSKEKDYRQVSVNSKKFMVHRIIAAAFLDDYSESLQVDHINGCKSDNRVENLRMLSNMENHQAFVRTARTASSRFRGVSKTKMRNKWSACVKSGAVRSRVSGFKSEEAAALAYDRIAKSFGFDDCALNRTNHPELAMLSGC